MSVYREIDSLFTASPTGGLQLALDYQAVVSSIDNILRTFPGERVMLPTFGSDIGNILFANIDDMLADQISDEIKIAINTWDPRVQVIAVDITPNPDYHFLSVKVSFKILGIDAVYNYQGSLFR